MRALTWGQLKPTIRLVKGVCSEATLLAAANEAQEQLLNRAVDPVGAWQRMRVCVGACNLLVWPRQVRHIKKVWFCNQPGQIVPEWWESIGYWQGGWGLADDELAAGYTLIDAGTRCSFDNVVSTSTSTKKIQAVASNTLDNGKLITLRYIDGNGSRVYNSTTGVEGETLTLTTTGVLTGSSGTTNSNGLVYTGGLYHVVKAATIGPVRLYEFDAATATQTRLLAVYEPSETNPIYRASNLPWLTNMSACPDDTSETCENNKTLTLAVKLQHIPFAVDNDPVIIGNASALKWQVKSNDMAEKHEAQLAQYYAGLAAQEVDGEIASYLGDGARVTIETPDVETWGPAVFNPL